MSQILQTIIKELDQMSDFVKDEELTETADILYNTMQNGRKVFVAGAGRSGCIARAFANRLMHVGVICYFVGDITTPPIQKGDLLFLLSGSGKTSSLVNMAQKAHSLQAEILTVTLQKESDIGKLATKAILLPGNTRLQAEETFVSVQPVGSSFEQLSWLTCDALILLLKEKLNLTNDDLLRHHANLE